MAHYRGHGGPWQHEMTAMLAFDAHTADCVAWAGQRHTSLAPRTYRK